MTSLHTRLYCLLNQRGIRTAQNRSGISVEEKVSQIGGRALGVLQNCQDRCFLWCDTYRQSNKGRNKNMESYYVLDLIVKSVREVSHHPEASNSEPPSWLPPNVFKRSNLASRTATSAICRQRSSWKASVSLCCVDCCCCSHATTDTT